MERFDSGDGRSVTFRGTTSAERWLVPASPAPISTVMWFDDAVEVSDMSLATLSGRPGYDAMTEKRDGEPTILLRTLLTIDLTGDLAGVAELELPSKTLPIERARPFDGLAGGAEARPE